MLPLIINALSVSSKPRHRDEVICDNRAMNMRSKASRSKDNKLSKKNGRDVYVDKDGTPHQGTETILQNPDELWDNFVQRAKNYFIKTATESIRDFEINPERPNSQLYFCLSFVDKEKSELGH